MKKSIFLVFALFSIINFATIASTTPVVSLNELVAKEVPQVLISDDKLTVTEVTFLKSGRGFYKTDLGTAEFRWDKKGSLITLNNFSNNLAYQKYVTEIVGMHAFEAVITTTKIEFFVEQAQLKARIYKEREPNSEDFINDPLFEKEFTSVTTITEANPSFLNNNLKLNGQKDLIIKLDPKALNPSHTTLTLDGNKGSISTLGFENDLNGLNQGSTLNYNKTKTGFDLMMENGDFYEVNFIESEHPNLMSNALVRRTTKDNEYLYLSNVVIAKRPFMLLEQDIIGTYVWSSANTNFSTEYVFNTDKTGYFQTTKDNNVQVKQYYTWNLDGNTLHMTRFFDTSNGVASSLQELNNCLSSSVETCVPFQKREMELIGESNGKFLFTRYLQINSEAFNYAYTDEEFDSNWKVDRNTAGMHFFIYTKK